MEQYIKKDALVAEIKKRIQESLDAGGATRGVYLSERMKEDSYILSIIDTLEVKELDLMIHTIIAECCDWLATNTNLSHDEIECCRNLMLTVKDEQLKAQKGE